ncbi:aspartate aminotransferase family protein [Microbacterium oleivorans]|uniref:aspartate aminotransferase family protein n=1 Tax=Microbacterium oleivorans TaxID=273677 RepID=UPI00203DEBC4|nr:aspartate aminotransferase family protein [Microbacterium oleivorans]MCM3695102.1 aspartate aminotransferase family protein [Microbacterium oleivorans]
MSTPGRMHMVNGFDPAAGTRLGPRANALLERRQRVLGAPYRLFYENPVEVSRGDGALLFDPDGVEYLDAYNNVPAVGHANPRVRAAVDAQLGRVNTHTRYLTEEVVTYSERLLSLFPGYLEQVVFACTGSEAVDLAVRIAGHVTGGTGVVITSNAYHGTTQASAALSPSLGPNNVLPPHVVTVPAPDPLRDPVEEGAAAALFSQRVNDAIDELERRGLTFSALIIDSVLSSDGLVTHPAGVIREAVDTARRRGGIYIADEVQPGFGRLGSTWWGFARHGVEPDLVVLGKPMGNGLPISAVVGRRAHMEAFGRDVRYFNTFGGTAVSVAAATAVLDEIEDRGLLPHASTVGGHLKKGLDEIASRDERIGQVRGEGLFLAVEFVGRDGGPDAVPDADLAGRVVNGLRARRVLVSASGRWSNVLKIRPPLVFDTHHADRLLTALDDVLGDVSDAGGPRPGSRGDS